MEDGAFWASKTSGYLRAFFYGAAYARSQGYNFGLADVARWALTDRSEQAEDILQGRRRRALVRGDTAAARPGAEDGRDHPDVPVAGAAVHGRSRPWPQRSARGQVSRRSTCADFATSQDTLYMIAQGQNEHSPMAGLFACLASEVHYAAGMVGSFTEVRPPPRPMLFALDEVCQLCPGAACVLDG